LSNFPCQEREFKNPRALAFAQNSDHSRKPTARPSSIGASLGMVYLHKYVYNQSIQLSWDENKRQSNPMKDENIDLLDISEEQMKRAVLRVNGKSVDRGKQRVNMFLDTFIVEHFKAKAGDRGYQTLINEALSEYIRHHDIKDDLRNILREELERAKR
jgi:uncharacterized protein (DUF4415 family)